MPNIAYDNMKRRTPIIAAFALCCIYSSHPASTHAQPTTAAAEKHIQVNHGRETRSKGWRLVWSDEFDGTTLDDASWNRCAAGSADWMRHMSPLDTLCRVENGTLRLYGVCRPNGMDDDRPYLTGGVQSNGKRSIRLGRVDVRARFDCAQGFWPAIWLMPDIDAPWPSGGEIDIMEHLNHDTIAYQTVHSSHTLAQREPRTGHGSTAPIDRDGFNVYSAVVTRNGVEFYINGRHTYTYPKLPFVEEDQYPFADHPFYVILSAQLGGSWVGRIDPSQLPVKMEIDYVRFYEKRRR